MGKITLDKLEAGKSGTVAGLNTNDQSILRKLMSMGILPGITLKMLQTFPSYVFEAGYTQVAVDKEIASVVIVNN